MQRLAVYGYVQSWYQWERFSTDGRDNEEEHIERKKYTYASVGLIIGAALGTVMFALSGTVWLIGAGAGLGLVIGAAIDLARA